ncbi:MAG TPA: hypothetical protein VF897_19180 [Roseiflexaceae bacterium]
MSSPLVLGLIIAIILFLYARAGIPNPAPREIVVVVPTEDRRGFGCGPIVLLALAIIGAILLTAR